MNWAASGIDVLIGLLRVGGLKRSMQHFTEVGEADAQEEEEGAGSARLHRGPARGDVGKLGRRGVDEGDRTRVWQGRRVGLWAACVLWRHPSRPRCRSPLSLTFTDREETSRGVAAGRSMRSISPLPGRAASKVSREICRNGADAARRTIGSVDDINPARRRD
jgi:hypothetical protein